MARAYTCDRCPTLFQEHTNLSRTGEIYETNSGFYRIRFSLDVTDYDSETKEPELCPACRTDMLNAIIGKIKPKPA